MGMGLGLNRRLGLGTKISAAPPADPRYRSNGSAYNHTFTNKTNWTDANTGGTDNLGTYDSRSVIDLKAGATLGNIALVQSANGAVAAFPTNPTITAIVNHVKLDSQDRGAGGQYSNGGLQIGITTATNARYLSLSFCSDGVFLLILGASTSGSPIYTPVTQSIWTEYTVVVNAAASTFDLYVARELVLSGVSYAASNTISGLGDYIHLAQRNRGAGSGGLVNCRTVVNKLLIGDGLINNAGPS